MRTKLPVVAVSLQLLGQLVAGGNEVGGRRRIKLIRRFVEVHHVVRRYRELRNSCRLRTSSPGACSAMWWVESIPWPVICGHHGRQTSSGSP
ncbi:MAG: hypothetical protein QOG10_5824 [Kribbellaceae bacterium]|nr:hypothetical protein [Kribbellaceae bacterium]